MRTNGKRMTRLRAFISLTLAAILSGIAVIAEANGEYQYYANDRAVRQLIRRIEVRTNSFRVSMRSALNRSRLDDTQREENINQLVSDFERATNQLRDHFNAGRTTVADAQAVLDGAFWIDGFMQRHRLAITAERRWNLLKSDLNTLASYYRIAWNWRNPSPGNLGVNDRWTGTFRLNSLQSDNEVNAVQRAIRRLPYNQRRFVYNALLARISAPEMIALERHGRTITLASSRAPQTTFEADGRRHLEQYPNSRRSSRVRATLNRGQFTIVSTGDRATDFSVTFHPLDNGNRLRVTRRLYAERLSQPVIIRTVYDRVSDVAQWGIFTETPSYPAIGNFIVPNGTRLVARLDDSLDTDSTRAGDRFTLTVLSPSQFQGAKIQGVVGNVDRGGRITGRTYMTLNLNQIRLNNGQPFTFDGIIESVRAANGENVSLDTENVVREDESQTERTIKRGAIGAAIGAIIGAIAEGSKGAAIGAVLGGGAGAGSVYVQGRKDIELMSGSIITIRAIAPRPIG